MNSKIKILMILFYPVFLLFSISASAQEFYFGNDLSYANQMEDCGAEFKEWGLPKDVYKIYAGHGNDLVRLRLWVDPDWQNTLEQPDGVKAQYSNLEDVSEAIQRAKQAGMSVLLDFHYSDFWADPARQVVPKRWQHIAGDINILADSVYQYTFGVLSELHIDGLLPEIVQIGNETNSGMLLHNSMNEDFEGIEYLEGGWARQAKLLKAAINAVRDVEDTTGANINVALHYAGIGEELTNWYRTAVSHGINDFEIIGFSYYYAWHGSSIGQVAGQVGELKDEFPGKQVMILETGYPWTARDFDENRNIITASTPLYEPLSRTTQQAYLVDLTKAVMDAGGDGVIFWESAWVSTKCRTPWGKGSSHDHVAFFEPETYDFIEIGGGGWMNAEIYDEPGSAQVAFKVEVPDTVQPSAELFVNGDLATGFERMYLEEKGVYSFVKYLSPGSEGSYYFSYQNSDEGREQIPASCSKNGDRYYSISDSTGTQFFAFKFGSCERVGETAVSGEEEMDFPESGVLFQNYPTPFNPLTHIHYKINEPAFVNLSIFNLLGQRVKTLIQEVKPAGLHKIEFNGGNLPSGMYLYSLKAGDYNETRTMLLLK